MTWLLIYHLAVSAFLLVVALNVALNWGVFVAPRERRFEPGDAPLVSILVPARNEARRIAPCLRSLLAQDYPNFETIVLDDRSEDGTAALVLELGFSREKSSEHRLIEGRPLPPGWIGKNWACHQLAAEAKGKYLLFTDADTVHEACALSACVGHALETGASLLSAWPRQLTETWSEKAVIPLVYVLLLGALPHRILHRLQRRPDYALRMPARWLATLGAANGQYVLFERAAYECIGGHAAVRDHLVEDVALGRLVAGRVAEGMRLINCDGSRLVRCRMYTSVSELWEGFTKNLRAAFSESAGTFWFFGLLQAAGLVLPFVWACLPWVNGRWWGLPVAQVAWLYALRAILAARFRTSWTGVWLHPVGQALSLIIGMNSWRLSTQRGVTWKGRTYRMNESAGSPATANEPTAPLNQPDSGQTHPPTMQVRRIKAADASSRLPLPATVKWPDGVWDAEVMRHGTMSAEIFAPRGRDHQSPHAQDELYVIISGTAELQAGGDQPLACAPGDLVFVPAGQPHHFEKISEGFATWVIFYGPTGGEATLAPTEPVTDQSNSQSP